MICLRQWTFLSTVLLGIGTCTAAAGSDGAGRIAQGVAKHISASADAPPDRRAKDTHRFADYPAKTPLRASPAMPAFSGEDAWAKLFRTRIQDAVQAGPNFAGHYSVIKLGCGTGCLVALLIDLEDGDILEMPLGGEAHYQLRLTHRIESRLLRAVWMDVVTDEYDVCIARDYVIAGDMLILLGEYRFKIQRFGHCSPA